MTPPEKIGNYRIIEKLAETPVTVIYRAEHTVLNRKTLLKVLREQVVKDRELVERFKREARIAATLRHPHIVEVYEFGRDGRRYFLALEFVEGETLEDALRRQGTLPLPQALRYMRDLLQALHYAHGRKIVHRDIKPSNLLINRVGTIKIADFGLAVIQGEARITREQVIAGTPAYMSPEQVNGMPPDPRSDIFSLGVVFYEMISGQSVFVSPSFSETLSRILTFHPPPLHPRHPEVPPGLDRVLAGMMAKQAEDRYPSCQAVLDDLAPLLEQFQISPEETPAEEHRRSSGKRVFRLVGGILSGLGLLFVILRFLILPSAPPPERPVVPPVSHLPDTVAVRSAVAETPPDLTPSEPPAVRQPQKTDAGKSSSSPGVVKKKPFLAEKPSVNKTPSPGKTTRSVAAPMGKLWVDCLPWARIYLNDKPVGETPLSDTLRLPAGEYRMRLENPAFPSYRCQVRLKGDSTQIFRINLTEIVGYLKIIVLPWAEVYLDGRKIGLTPLPDSLPVFAGEHLLSLKNPLFPAREETIRVEAGKSVAVRVSLERNE